MLKLGIQIKQPVVVLQLVVVVGFQFLLGAVVDDGMRSQPQDPLVHLMEVVVGFQCHVVMVDDVMRYCHRSTGTSVHNNNSP